MLLDLLVNGIFVELPTVPVIVLSVGTGLVLTLIVIFM